jgi:hypothetical protein
MPEYVDPEVESLRESDSSTAVTLLLGVSGPQNETVKSVEETGVTVEDTLGQETLRVIAPESAIDTLCKLEGIKSIEIERNDVQVLTAKNFRSPHRVTR